MYFLGKGSKDNVIEQLKANFIVKHTEIPIFKKKIGHFTTQGINYLLFSHQAISLLHPKSPLKSIVAQHK
jgi:hypothetical protein